MASLDRWPSERRLLFDPITGTRIEQLTDYPAHHWHLSAPDTPLTPAGERLLFTSNRAGGPSRSLFCLDMRSGIIQQVTETLLLDPVGVTPAANGRQAIAALPSEEGEVSAVDLETGEAETLAVFVGARLDGCHRSASGEYVVTVVTQAEEATLTAVHTEGMRTVPVLADLRGATAARFSPDSKNSVLYVTLEPPSLRCVEFDGSGDRELASGIRCSVLGVRCSGDPTDRTDPSDPTDPNTEHRAPSTEYLISSPPAWLGSGDEVIFIPGPGPGPVLAVPRWGGRPRELSSLACSWARSNGAGDQIVAVAADGIILIDPRAGEAKPLCSVRHPEARPCFSPDDRSVIFTDDDARGYSQLFQAYLEHAVP